MVVVVDDDDDDDDDDAAGGASATMMASHHRPDDVCASQRDPTSSDSRHAAIERSDLRRIVCVTLRILFARRGKNGCIVRVG